MKLPLILLILTLTTGCATISSSFYFTKGSQFLQQGDYERAIVELEKAVEEDPSMARNHTNLAAAYFANGDLQKAWYQSRQAVRAPYQDGISQLQFKGYYKSFIVDQGLNKKGVSFEEVSAKLGLPDELTKNEAKSTIFCVYGTCRMSFIDGLLVNCSLQ